ncbi:MAG: GNAT family N-acetyltransferase [Pirellulaceae bacterium]
MTAELAISAMTLDDYDDVVALWRSSANLGEVETRDEIAAFLQRNPGFSPLARLEGRLVGAALCGHDGRRGYLAHVAVAAELRRRGVAQQMVRFCLDRLTEIGIPRASIHIYVANDDGQHFWRGAGWRERTDLKVYSYDL